MPISETFLFLIQPLGLCVQLNQSPIMNVVSLGKEWKQSSSNSYILCQQELTEVTEVYRCEMDL